MVSNNGMFGKRKESVIGQCIQQEWNQKRLSHDFFLRLPFFKRDVIPSSVLWINIRSYNHPRTLEEWGCSEKKGKD